MIKKLIIILSVLFMAVGRVDVFSVGAEEETFGLPDKLELEYSGTEETLPVCSTEDDKVFTVEIKDKEGKTLAENVLRYRFDVGDYVVEYTVLYADRLSDAAGFKRVKVTVRDTTAPTIFLRGEYKKQYEVGEKPDDVSGFAVDIRDGEVSCEAKIFHGGKEVKFSDPLAEGKYSVVYSAEDRAGNKAEKTVEFTVRKGLSKGCKGLASANNTAFIATTLTAALIIIKARNGRR